MALKKKFGGDKKELEEAKKKLEEVNYVLGWYRSTSGALSRDDAISMLKQVNDILSGDAEKY